MEELPPSKFSSIEIGLVLVLDLDCQYPVDSVDEVLRAEIKELDREGYFGLPVDLAEKALRVLVFQSVEDFLGDYRLV